MLRWLKMLGIGLVVAIGLILALAVVSALTHKDPVPSPAPAPAVPPPPAETLSFSNGIVEVRLPATDYLLVSMIRHGELARVKFRFAELAANPTYKEAVLFQVWTQIKVQDAYANTKEAPGITASVKRAEVVQFNFAQGTAEDFERFARAKGSIQINPILN